ncbi:hypothetical protein [Solilutibacter silvestris]|uniref:Uncharacterized protein n=1 Tax=Solilutibacter silvestris TaxID=1645665 RepID=A0A2K1Q3M1_9GAMM|nr:hypothetical protein [Lysobacter silvestris]PNS09638.1 hypothetical protein Lysil_1267 [Lysobacter silvestris]
MSGRINGFRALFGGLTNAPRHWRMLLLWLLASLIPAIAASVPLRKMIDATFGYSPQAADIDAGRNMPLLADGIMTMLRHGGSTALGVHIGVTALLALLLSPLLVGMLIASLREGRPLGFGESMHGGLREYWRQFRLWLVIAIPAGVLVGAASFASDAIGKSADAAILASQADHLQLGATVILVAAIAIAHCALEAARAQFGADGQLRTAWRALLRGVRLMLRRPFSVALVYLVTMLLPALVTPLLLLDLIKGNAVLAMLVLQLGLLVLGALRAARLIGLARLSAGSR